MGELALASSLSSLTKNPVSSSTLSERAVNTDKSTSTIPPVPPERDASSAASAQQHYQRSASMVVDRLRPLDGNTTLTPASKISTASKSSKELDYGSVKLRKHYSMTEKKQRNSTIETSSASAAAAASEHGYVRYEDVSAMLSGRETIRRHYHSAIRKYEALKEEYDFLHKRYADLVTTHSSVVFKLELAQEDLIRTRKNYEDVVQEKNVAIRERNGLQQQCTAAIRQWDKALRECNEAKDQLSKVQQQRDEAMKEINQAMAVRIKATKDLARLTEERNAAVAEYSLIMSERDSVHKEIEKLQEELHENLKKVKALEKSNKTSNDTIDGLKKELLSSVFDNERLHKECADLREKLSEFVVSFSDHDMSSPTSPSKSSNVPSGWNLWGSTSSGVSTSFAATKSTNNSGLIKQNHLSASNGSSVSTLSHRAKLEAVATAGDLPNNSPEVDSLRRQVERLQHDLMEAHQETEVAKRQREWAFNEKEKIGLERESIRYLCDRLRKERDQVVSKLAKALTESDEFKRQCGEASVELNNLKDKLEATVEKEQRPSSAQPAAGVMLNNISRDSAIDTDLHEFENGFESGEATLKRNTEKRKSTLMTSQAANKPSKQIESKKVDGTLKASLNSSPGSESGSSTKSRTAVNCSPTNQAAKVVNYYHTIHPRSDASPMHIPPHHSHQASTSGYRSDDNSGGRLVFDRLSTLPKRSQRIRIPSNPSSKSTKVSEKELLPLTSSLIEQQQQQTRQSPSTVIVERLEQVKTLNPRSTIRRTKPRPRDLRNIEIEKDLDNMSSPLGISIICDENGTGSIFVSSVTENSSAARAGLYVGDQLLDICGINMRCATTYEVARTVLRESTTSGDKMKMLVQYNPDKYAEINSLGTVDGDLGEGSSADDECDDEEDEDDESTVSTNSVDYLKNQC